MANLSKDFTLLSLRGLLRSIVNEVGENNLQSLVIDDLIHTCVLEISDLLAAASYPEYGATVGYVSYSSTIDVSALRISKIVKVVDSVNGTVLPSSSVGFDNLVNRPQEQGNLHYYWFGQQILLYKPASISSYGILTIHYLRIPNKAVNDTDLIDVSDRFANLLVNKAKFLVYEILKQKPPEGLAANIDAKVEAILKASAGVPT